MGLEKEETYIGDGLYVSYDGFHIKLRAPRVESDSEIYLEPVVLKEFLDYLKKKGAIRGYT